MFRYINYFFTRMTMIVVDSITVVAQGSLEAAGVLKFYPVQVWKKSAIETWGPKPVLIAGKTLRRVIRNFEGFMIVARYRTCYNSISNEMKKHYKEIKRRRRNPDL
ncbi:MAG: hypothetical protein ACUVWJ_03205 [Spirochaetota bacterium]